jgi:DNA repair ATPase RecN
MGWCSGDRNACENKLLDTIEAQQQEKLQRIKEISEQWAKEIVRADELQQENEQLKAQNGAMREAIQNFIDKANILTGSDERFIAEDSTYWKFKKVLETTPTTYHNPADVEALARDEDTLRDISNYLYDILPTGELTPQEADFVWKINTAKTMAEKAIEK